MSSHFVSGLSGIVLAKHRRRVPLRAMHVLMPAFSALMENRNLPRAGSIRNAPRA